MPEFEVERAVEQAAFAFVDAIVGLDPRTPIRPERVVELTDVEDVETAVLVLCQLHGQSLLEHDAWGRFVTPARSLASSADLIYAVFASNEVVTVEEVADRLRVSMQRARMALHSLAGAKLAEVGVNGRFRLLRD